MANAEAFAHLGDGLHIDYLACEALKPYKNNPRTHSKNQIKQLARSIENFGFTNPVLVDENRNIIAGHGRVEAAKIIGLERVPVIHLNHLNEAQKRAYIIADNKLAENAGWNEDLLKTELEYITDIDPDFDLGLTGFEVPEIDLLLNPEEPVDKADQLIPVPQEQTVSKLGDLWFLGEHRLLCADATKPESYEKLLGDEKAAMIFTDPPYNVEIDGHVCGKGKIKHAEFQMAAGEMSQQEFTEFLGQVFANLCQYSKDGSLHFICMDWRHIKELMEAASIYTEMKNLCVWNKSNGGMGSLYRSKHELIFIYKNGKKPHINNIELGKHGRNRTNVWDYAGVNTFENAENLALHPTVKPVGMIQDAIIDCTRRSDIVLDSFGGSGSTLIAAERCRRKAYLLELDPQYVDVIIRRYQEFTGDTITHEDGSTFKEKDEALL